MIGAASSRGGRRLRGGSPLAVAGVVGVALLTAAAGAHADVRAMAEALYDEGRQLLAAGRTAEACAKFDESYRIAPATGALLNLAACHETLGNTATAWAHFRTAVVAARRDGRADRVDFAQQHIAQLENVLTYLTIGVSPELAATNPQISLDGAVLGPAAWNVPVPVDPGAHRLAIVGRTELPFVVQRGQRSVRLDLADAVTPASAGSRPAPNATESASGSRRSRVAAFVVAGTGAGALAVGSYFGLRAFSEWHRFEDECAAPTGCPAGIGDPQGNARRAARISDVMFGVGAAAGVAAGILFYVSRTPDERPSDQDGSSPHGRATLMPVISPTGVHLDWSWRW